MGPTGSGKSTVRLSGYLLQIPLAYISHSSLSLPLASTQLWVIPWSRARARSRLSSCPFQNWPTATSFSLILRDLMIHTNPTLISLKWWPIG